MCQVVWCTWKMRLELAVKKRKKGKAFTVVGTIYKCCFVVFFFFSGKIKLSCGNNQTKKHKLQRQSFVSFKMRRLKRGRNESKQLILTCDCSCMRRTWASPSFLQSNIHKHDLDGPWLIPCLTCATPPRLCFPFCWALMSLGQQKFEWGGGK